MARCADTYEAGKGIIIPLIGDDLVSLLDSSGPPSLLWHPPS
jgi:hypothetical protein